MFCRLSVVQPKADVFVDAFCMSVVLPHPHPPKMAARGRPKSLGNLRKVSTVARAPACCQATTSSLSMSRLRSGAYPRWTTTPSPPSLQRCWRAPRPPMLRPWRRRAQVCGQGYASQSARQDLLKWLLQSSLGMWAPPPFTQEATQQSDRYDKAR